MPEGRLCEAATTNQLVACLAILAHDTCSNSKALRLMEAETREWIEVLRQRRATVRENTKRFDAALATSAKLSNKFGARFVPSFISRSSRGQGRAAAQAVSVEEASYWGPTRVL